MGAIYEISPPLQSLHTREPQRTLTFPTDRLFGPIARCGDVVVRLSHTYSCLRLHKFCTGSEGLNAPSEKCLIEPHGRCML